MQEKINEIMKKYYYDEEEYYFKYRYDEVDKEFSAAEEIAELFQKAEIQHYVAIVECFDSCGYSCDMLIVSWVEDGILNKFNQLLECM